MHDTRLKISLVQVNFQQGPTDCCSYYLPYSVGCVWAYANSFPSIRDRFQLEHVLWKRDDVDQTAQKLSNQDVVGFSTYVWNRNYNFTLARKIKELNSQCFIFFGGPEPAHTDPDFFKKHPYIDVIVMQEGEITVKNLLENLGNPAAVGGIAYNHRGELVKTSAAERIQDLAQIPSPYLTGFFDNILANSPEVKEWAAILETNRGCPYQCTFCDWGSLTYSKIRHFPIERVLAEIEWMAHHKIHYMSIADANFGMFIDRDDAVVEKYLEMQAKFGFPQASTASYAKNQKKEVLGIVEKLVKRSMKFNSGLQISMQTLDEDVLAVIKRKNLGQQNAKEILKEASKRNVVVGTEIIMGLPSDTYQSWKKNYWKLLDMGLHENIDFYISQLLQNSEMNLTQREIYGIKTANIYDYLSPIVDPREPDDVKEYIDVTIAHDDLPYEDWIKSYTFSWFMNTFHIGGLSEYYSRFVNTHQDVAFQTFYDDLYEFLESDSWFNIQTSKLRQLLDSWTSDGRLNHSVHGTKLTGWNLSYFTLMGIHYDAAQKEHVFALLQQFMQRYGLAEDLMTDLAEWQRARIVDMHQREQYPKIQTFAFNIHDYIIHKTSLQKGKFTLEFGFPERQHISDQEFLERLFFGRRRRFGKTWIENVNSLVIEETHPYTSVAVSLSEA